MPCTFFLFGWGTLLVGNVIGAQYDDGALNLGIVLELFDDGASFVRLFVKDDRLQIHLSQEAGDGIFRAMVVAVHDKYPARVRRPGNAGSVRLASEIPTLLFHFRDSGFKVLLGSFNSLQEVPHELTLRIADAEYAWEEIDILKLT